jgi:hypothetical protein
MPPPVKLLVLLLNQQLASVGLLEELSIPPPRPQGSPPHP